MIDANDRDTDWIPATSFEVIDLLAKIADHSVNLLNHRFGENLHLHADFHGCDRPSRDGKSGVGDRSFAGDYFSECPVAPTRFNSPSAVLPVENTSLCVYRRIQLWRPMDVSKILV